jgi:hypothetical protein
MGVAPGNGSRRRCDVGHPRPFHRIHRPVSRDLPNAGFSSWAYIRDPAYAKIPGHYTLAYLLIENDLNRLFEYVEPSDTSLATFSFRIHELLMRACIEVEANCKSILTENKYTPAMDRFGQPIMNMSIYRRIERSHHLSSYEVGLPSWNGGRKVLRPFAAWQGAAPLTWYQAYNASKHDRAEAFQRANLESLLDAVAGLLVLLSAQFKNETFGSQADHLVFTSPAIDEMDSALGETFRIRFPKDWTRDEEYAFNWADLKDEAVRFDKFDYDMLP